MTQQLRLTIRDAVREVKKSFEGASLMTDLIADSVIATIEQRGDQMFDKRGQEITDLAGYAAWRARLRLIDNKRRQARRRRILADHAAGSGGIPPTELERLAALHRRELHDLARGERRPVPDPVPMLSLDRVKQEITQLKAGQHHETLGFDANRTRRIGEVLDLVYLQGKTYDEVERALSISKPTVCKDVLLGRLYLRMLAKKLAKQSTTRTEVTHDTDAR